MELTVGICVKFTTPPLEIAIASVSLALPILPALGMTTLPLNVPVVAFNA